MTLYYFSILEVMNLAGLCLSIDSQLRCKMCNLFTLWEVGNEVRFSRLDEVLYYNGSQCKYIQIEKERTRSFMNDSDDIPMIICIN